ncbi:MATH and LRR domain-containing protein PFE0570w [Parasteatoda tepidariorum]|uniref:MATH and LRR domain-containing protein PFE0570w n=1 Tax=Parasteatoda tepidariorum TaxID=114398 RepID=UPI001C721AAA|nr:uncharacterized protein LOC107450139 [Parasteatoda tepidariorum]
MEPKAVLRDKSVRDIWAAIDKSTINILQNTKSQTLYSSPKASSPDKQNVVPSGSQAKSTSSYFSTLEKANPAEAYGLFQPEVCKVEDDNVSLYSIWTPTNNDNLKNKHTSSYESPLIDLDTSENLKQTKAFPTNSSYGTNENSLIDSDVPVNTNIYTSTKDSNYESSLIDLGIPENSYTKHNKCISPKDYTYRRFRHDSGSNSNNDNVSEKSLDGLNEETFGKFSYAPNESELTLAAISDATAAYELSEDKSIQETSKTKVFECSETAKKMREVQETATGTKPKTYITKVYKQNNIQQSYQRDGKKRNGNNKNTREMKDQNVPNNKNIKPNSDEILSVSRENLAICKARPLQGKFRRNFTNNEQRRVTRTRETFHSQVFPNVQAGIATRTRETFHKKGNMSYYTTEKITYVRGEKLENMHKDIHQDQENNIVWQNISNLGHINDREVLWDNDIKLKKYFQGDKVPQYYDKGKRLPNSNWKTSDEKYKLDEDNIPIFKNQNISKKQESKESNCLDQRKTSKNEVSQGKKLTFRGNLHWQSSTDNSDLDEPINIPQDKSSEFINKQSQKTGDVGHADKKNVVHFKIYDPKLRRPTKKKIMINQYPEAKLKSNTFDNPQTRKTTMHYVASGGALTKDSEEQFPSKNAADKNLEQTKLKNNSFKSSQNEKTGIPYAKLMNKDLQDHFEFLENINLDKADGENKTFVKDVLSNIILTNSNNTRKIPGLPENSITMAKSDLKSLINDGKEIADLIVGCQRTLDMFKSFYYEWIDLRKQSISLLEQIVMIINNSSRKNDTMKHVIAAINIAAGAANFVPHPGVQLGAKVAGAVGGFFANFFTRTDCKKDVNAKEYEIKEIFQKDIDSSSYVYIYGVQCGTQFQETCNVISKFYKHLLEINYQSVIKNHELLEFMNEIIEHKSSDTLTFYKRLQMCYERLIINSNSVDSRAFVRIFEDVPEAVEIIDLLPWKFDSDGFDNSIVQDAWGELLLLFQADNPATVDIIKNKIQNCLLFLKKEHRILSRNVTGLFRETVK